MLVQTRKKDHATEFDLEFEADHPKYGILIQRLALNTSEILTVHFNRQLSQFEAEEDTIHGGHPTTVAIKNDLAEVLLGFFVPWELLPALFQQHASEYNTKRDACSKIWNIVEPTLSAYLRHFTENFNLLRKTKADITINKALQDTEIGL